MALRRFTRVLVGVLTMMCVSLSSAGDKTVDLSSLSDAEINALVIRLERTACYGTCPAYTLTIHGDGRVEYSGQRNVRQKGAMEGRIETGTIRNLLSEFAQAKFVSLPEDYSEEKCTCRRCTDMATAITELDVKGDPQGKALLWVRVRSEDPL